MSSAESQPEPSPQAPPEPPRPGGVDPAYRDRFGGLGRLYGDDALERLAGAHVAVIGIGGVGSWTAEALARSGVGRLTLIDLDEVCVTNTNRQLHALEGTVGQPKVDVMAARVRRIHPGCDVSTVMDFFTESNADALLDAGGFDVVVDAIDTPPHKALLIVKCLERGLPLVVCGGAGGRRDPSMLAVADLTEATHDGLLRRLRKRLRRQHGFPAPETGPWGLPAVYSKERPVFPQPDGSVCEQAPGQSLRLDCRTGFGTAAFVTGAYGLAAASVAVRLVVQPEPAGSSASPLPVAHRRSLT